MAMGPLKPSSGRKRRYQPVHEINVTPFVDVMLVLLIVFMVTAPLLTQSTDDFVVTFVCDATALVFLA